MSVVLGEIRQQAADILARSGLLAPRQEADNLISAVSGLSPAYILGHPEYRLTQQEADKISQAISRRAKREPLAYICGRTVFFDLDFSLNEGVLIPRPDSEILVETAWQWLKNNSVLPAKKASILDLCTGCGCIGLSIAVHLRREGIESELILTDVDKTAIACAQNNIGVHDLEQNAAAVQADLFPNEFRRFDLITANPPYIPRTDIDSLMPEVRCYEPRQALDGGSDGLDFYRRILHQAHRWLMPGGAIFFEHGYDQGPALRALIRETGKYVVFPTVYDYGGNPRVSGGCLLWQENMILGE